MNIQIRQAIKSDWQSIQRLNNDVFQSEKEHDPDLIVDYAYLETGVKYYQDLANGTYGHCLIAETEGKAIGYVALAIKDFDYRKSKYVEVENMGVSPDYRSQGVGKILIDGAVAWAKQQGAQKLYVEAFWGNKRGLNFYKANGFSKIGVELEKTL